MSSTDARRLKRSELEGTRRCIVLAERTHPFGRYALCGYRRGGTCGAWILLWLFFKVFLKFFTGMRRLARW